MLVGDPWLHDGMDRREHDMVLVVHDAFMNGGLLAEDFERLPVRFQLDWGVTVYVYERVRSTSLEKFARALALMEEEIRPRPGSQRDWIANVNHPDRDVLVLKDPDSGWTLHWKRKLGPGAELADLVYLGALPEAFRLTGRVAVPPGIEVTLRVMTLDAEGEIVHSGESRRVDAGTTDLSELITRKGAQFVAVEVRPRATGHISPAVDQDIAHLAVEPDPELRTATRPGH